MSLSQLHAQAAEILEEIRQQPAMRKGSITPQMVSARKKDGTPTLRGPYHLYSCKKKGRTVSRRISKEDVPTYQKQIARFRRFQQLMAELAEIGHDIADRELRESEEQKGT